MNALLALLGLALDRGWSGLDQRRGRSWFRVYMRMMDEQFGALAEWGAVLPVVLWTGVPVVGAVLALWFLGELHTWLATAGGFLMVVTMLGPAHPGRAAERYARALDRDEDGASEAGVLLEGPDDAEPLARSRSVVEGLPVWMLQRVFGGAAWVLLAGPVGAVLWRVVSEMEQWLRERAAEHDAPRHAAVLEFTGVLAWLPVRLLALSLAFSGRTEEALAAWRSWRRPAGGGWWTSDRDLLRAVALAALAEPADAEDRGAHQVWAMLALLDRVLLAWLVVLALVWLGWTLA